MPLQYICIPDVSSNELPEAGGVGASTVGVGDAVRTRSSKAFKKQNVSRWSGPSGKNSLFAASSFS